MEDVHTKNEPLGRFCHRLVPVEIACKADLQLFEARMGEILLPKHFPGEKSHAWMLNFKCRNNTKYSRPPFLAFLDDKLSGNNFVDFQKPDLVINVDIIQHLMCLSVLPKYNEYKRYALRAAGAPTPAAKPKKDAPPPPAQNEEKPVPNEPEEAKEGDDGDGFKLI
eukprot:TRINITY_DN2112_c0_g1_i1.p1 TRINITY_DN2112_c0_g1~~TRINITY_DN2112_c0_g1_i1.p1  ORF type:complete len:166 (+),score=40.88 TRINITY_DN2112_c0_g1_i1:405-902(+)